MVIRLTVMRNNCDYFIIMYGKKRYKQLKIMLAIAHGIFSPFPLLFFRGQGKIKVGTGMDNFKNITCRKSTRLNDALYCNLTMRIINT